MRTTRRFFVFSALGSQPAMRLDPLLGVSLQIEIAEVAFSARRPNHLNTPMATRLDWPHYNAGFPNHH